MSKPTLIISERNRDIGGFKVGRLLPFRQKRMVGPFIYMDHMGPARLGPEKYLDVDQHPHIGLSTLTYLLEGEIVHRDSMGNEQVITPGAVNWMVAGSGVTHTERTPEYLRDGQAQAIHGYQIWLALPDGMEETEPEFHHVPEKDLPRWVDSGASFTLIAGQGFGRVSPVPVLSEMFFIEVIATKIALLELSEQLAGEIGICVVEGEIEYRDERIGKGKLPVCNTLEDCKVKLKPGSHLFILGGTPYATSRNIYWNFVSSSKEKIEEAKMRWQKDEFPKVPDDRTYVPLP